jgi:hypothetical protein
VSGSSTIVAYWWGCYLIAGFVGEFAVLQHPETLDALRVYAGSYFTSEALRVIAAVLAALMVWKIDEGTETVARTALAPSAAPVVSPSEATP